MKKLIFCSVLFIVAIGILMLPDPLQRGFDQLVTEQGFESLPDADLRTIAEQEWEAGRKETAISILDYMIEENMGDAASAKALREQYLNKIRSDDSSVGHLRSAAYGFATGKVDDLSSLAGSSAADVFIWGDVRDLVREIVFEDETDEIVVALSAAGIVTTIYPPGEIAIDVTKALKRVSAFSAPMIDLMKKMLKGFKNLSDAGKKDKIKYVFMPFYELSKKSTWGEFTTMVRYCRNLEQVKLLTYLSSLSPTNGKKLSQILAVAGNQGMKLSGQIFDQLGKYGQKGMDRIYSVLRKGPAGIRFIADHPTLVARSLKNVKKASPVALNFFHDKWNNLMVRSQALAIALKYSMAFLLILFVAHQIFSLFTLKKVGGISEGASWKVAAPIALAIGIVGLVYLYNIKDVSQSFDVSQEILSSQSSNFYMGREQGGQLGDISFLVVVLMINIFIQKYCINLAKGKISQIQGQSINSSAKLSLMENLDIYFDLPMYFGLGMTILAFILITFLGAESARLWAYFSTLIGIGCTAYMRVNFLHKAKEAIINDIQLEVNREIA